MLDRKVTRHYSFAGGPHRCVGAHLAAELAIALEGWHRLIPEYELAGRDRLVQSGPMIGLEGFTYDGREKRRRCRSPSTARSVRGTGAATRWPCRLFDCDDEGFPVVLAETVEDAERVSAARTAEASCPERAISVTEA